MICVRCGYCCIYNWVLVVNDPKKGIQEDNLIEHLGQGEPCIHLGGDKPGEYFCRVHDRKWYKDTPCYSHSQIEHGNTVCRMGDHIVTKERELSG